LNRNRNKKEAIQIMQVMPFINFKKIGTEENYKTEELGNNRTRMDMLFTRNAIQ
jgi:hypothetical protein